MRSEHYLGRAIGAFLIGMCAMIAAPFATAASPPGMTSTPQHFSQDYHASPAQIAAGLGVFDFAGPAPGLKRLNGLLNMDYANTASLEHAQPHLAGLPVAAIAAAEVGGWHCTGVVPRSHRLAVHRSQYIAALEVGGPPSWRT